MINLPGGWDKDAFSWLFDTKKFIPWSWTQNIIFENYTFRGMVTTWL